MKISFLARLALMIASAAVILWVANLNWRLVNPGRVETAVSQLRFLAKSLDGGGAERMQSVFPEGYVFTWALYGLAAAQVARTLPPSDARRDEMLRSARIAVSHVDSDQARKTFTRDMEPMYGAFYSAWSLYLRSAVLRATGDGDPDPFDLNKYDQDCEAFASALSKSESPFLPSYPGMAWPADTGIGVAALAIRDATLERRYQLVIKQWIEAVRSRRDPGSGAIPHSVNSANGLPLESPRGESLALLSYVLVDVDSSLAMEQYRILRRNFVDYSWGLPGVRVYPHGADGRGDIDSGPVVFGLGGPATVVGAGAAIVNGDEDLATDLLTLADLVGFPIEAGGQRSYAAGLVPVGDAFLAWARTATPPPLRIDYVPIIPGWWRLPFHAVSILLGILALGMAIRVGRGWLKTPKSVGML